MTAELTPDALAELWRLLDSATARPWVVDDEGDDVAVIVDEGDEFSFTQIAADLHRGDDGLTDARLIVAAVNALPDLLAAAAERDALAAKVEALADWHETKADKARRFRIEINGQNPVMDKAAEVHADAARRIRVALDGGES